ncbi:MAG: TSUP family transporter [Actinomycetales bacterium]
MIGGLSPFDLALLGLAVAFIGVSKTALPGVGALSVALFATVLPARESTGVILPLLMVGDVLAVLVYRRDADRPTLLRLMLPIVVGVLAGVGFVYVADDVVMSRSIGVVLLVLVAVHLALARWRAEALTPAGWLASAGYGWLAGFTTMVANAAGPVMSLYLLAARLDKRTFLGTMAWFSALANVFKLPFSVGLGLVTEQSLLLDAVLAPLVVVGAVAGRAVIDRISQALFGRLVLVFTVVAAVNLIL